MGSAGLILEESYVTRDLIFINSSKLSRPDYIALYLYLCIDFSYRLMVRSSSMTAQPHLTITLIRNMPLFNFSSFFKNVLCKVYEESESLMAQAIALYSSAQFLLLSTLNYHPITQTGNHTAKSLSESFGTMGRLDAEYYQPKYDELFQMLSALPTKRLKRIVNITKSIEPGSEYYGNAGIPFIRVSDVSKDGINTPSIKIPKTTVPSIENLYPKKDTILFSKDGSIGIAYKIEDNMKAVTSGALLHLTVKNPAEVLPDYLTLVLNSDIVKLQAERDSSGAVIQHWKPSDIEQIVVPILPTEIQQQIAEKIGESFFLRRQSEQLLENAKHAVELAIEQGEGMAIAWLQDQE